jgi:hypothetical protein
VQANGKAVEAVVEPARQTFDYVDAQHVNVDPSGGALDGPDRGLNDVAIPPADELPVEDLVEDANSQTTEPDIDEETPLLDIAAEAPEQLDGTAAAASEDGTTPDTQSKH